MRTFKHHSVFFGLLESLGALLCVPGFLEAGVLYRYTDPAGRLVITDDATRVVKETPQRVEKIPTQVLRPDSTPKQAQEKAQTLSEKALFHGDALVKGTSTPVSVRDRKVLVPVEIVHRSYGPMRGNFLLDTGATATAITETFADSLGIPEDEGKKTFAMVAGGGRIEARRVELDTLRIGPYEWRAVPVLVFKQDTGYPNGEDDVQGLLGMNLFQGASLRIDTKSGMLSFENLGQTGPKE